MHVSRDCGETWEQVADLAFAIHDLAWLKREEGNVLLMATDKGLYELAMERGSTPVQLVVDAANPSRGFYAVVAFVDGRGGSNVALAARQQGGIFLSRNAGRTESFVAIHPGGEDIRVLAVQRLGLSSFLWAGITVAGNEQGKGCLRWELPSSPQSVESPEGWRPLQIKWEGGSCRGLAFNGLDVSCRPRISPASPGSTAPSPTAAGRPRSSSAGCRCASRTACSRRCRRLPCPPRAAW